MSTLFSILQNRTLDDTISEREFDIAGYNTLVTKHDHMKRHMHGLGVYIKSGIPCARDLSYEDPEHSYISMRLAMVHTTAYIFFLYRPSDDNLAVIDSISSKIDQILVDNSSASIHLCGDFNVHNKDWLVFSNKTTHEGTDCQNFAVSHDLTQIIDFPTRIPDVEHHFQSLLDLFLLSTMPVFSKHASWYIRPSCCNCKYKPSPKTIY